MVYPWRCASNSLSVGSRSTCWSFRVSDHLGENMSHSVYDVNWQLMFDCADGWMLLTQSARICALQRCQQDSIPRFTLCRSGLYCLRVVCSIQLFLSDTSDLPICARCSSEARRLAVNEMSSATRLHDMDRQFRLSSTVYVHR
jgi:hypothetical protein